MKNTINTGGTVPRTINSPRTLRIPRNLVPIEKSKRAVRSLRLLRERTIIEGLMPMPAFRTNRLTGETYRYGGIL